MGLSDPSGMVARATATARGKSPLRSALIAVASLISSVSWPWAASSSTTMSIWSSRCIWNSKPISLPRHWQRGVPQFDSLLIVLDGVLEFAFNLGQICLQDGNARGVTVPSLEPVDREPSFFAGFSIAAPREVNQDCHLRIERLSAVHSFDLAELVLKLSGLGVVASLEGKITQHGEDANVFRLPVEELPPGLSRPITIPHPQPGDTQSVQQPHLVVGRVR